MGTSANELTSLIHQLLCQVVLPDVLLEAQEVQASSTQVEVCGNAQQHNHDGEVDVEAI